MSVQKSISNRPGDRFGKLVLVEEAPRFTHARKWFASCDCGNETIVWQHNLRSGATTCCGECLNRAQPVYHGLSRTPLYINWQQMRARCKNKNAPNYRYYGARGIAVCAEWDTDFLAFYNWSIHNGYATGLSITLRDNDRNYEPGNCEWSSPTKRNRNQRGTKLDFTKAVEIRNKKAAGVSAFDLSKQYNISVTHVHGIVSGRKWNGVA